MGDKWKAVGLASRQMVGEVKKRSEHREMDVLQGNDLGYIIADEEKRIYGGSEVLLIARPIAALLG